MAMSGDSGQGGNPGMVTNSINQPVTPANITPASKMMDNAANVNPPPTPNINDNRSGLPEMEKLRAGSASAFGAGSSPVPNPSSAMPQGVQLPGGSPAPQPIPVEGGTPLPNLPQVDLAQRTSLMKKLSDPVVEGRAQASQEFHNKGFWGKLGAAGKGALEGFARGGIRGVLPGAAAGGLGQFYINKRGGEIDDAQKLQRQQTEDQLRAMGENYGIDQSQFSDQIKRGEEARVNAMQPYNMAKAQAEALKSQAETEQLKYNLAHPKEAAEAQQLDKERQEGLDLIKAGGTLPASEMQRLRLGGYSGKPTPTKFQYDDYGKQYTEDPTTGAIHYTGQSVAIDPGRGRNSTSVKVDTGLDKLLNNQYLSNKARAQVLDQSTWTPEERLYAHNTEGKLPISVQQRLAQAEASGYTEGLTHSQAGPIKEHLKEPKPPAAKPRASIFGQGGVNPQKKQY